MFQIPVQSEFKEWHLVYPVIAQQKESQKSMFMQPQILKVRNLKIIFNFCINFAHFEHLHIYRKLLINTFKDSVVK